MHSEMERDITEAMRMSDYNEMMIRVDKICLLYTSIVKAAQGKLVYDLPRLIQNLPVDNAYDAVKELPGVIEMNGCV